MSMHACGSCTRSFDHGCVFTIVHSSIKTKEELWKLREVLTSFGGIPEAWGKRKGSKRARDVFDEFE